MKASPRTFLAFAMILVPFGPASDLIQKKNPWHGFDYKDSVLMMVRLEKIEKADCAKYLTAAETKPIEGVFGKDFEAWKPWEPDELDGVQDCDDFPCKIKLNTAEVSAMKAENKTSRLSKYQQLIAARVQKYQQSGQRDGYEFEGAPLDPSTIFEKLGLKSTLKPKPTGTLVYRENDFSSGKTKPIRQVMEHAVASSPTEYLSVLRDVYTNHFFDAWGEYLDVSCEADSGAVWLAQGLVVDLDLLKKGDLFSVISRSKMREAFSDTGSRYLERIAEKLKEQVGAAK